MQKSGFAWIFRKKADEKFSSRERTSRRKKFFFLIFDDFSIFLWVFDEDIWINEYQESWQLKQNHETFGVSHGYFHNFLFWCIFLTIFLKISIFEFRLNFQIKIPRPGHSQKTTWKKSGMLSFSCSWFR